MAVAILLIMLGLIGPIASVQWRHDEWIPAGRWVMRTLSPHAVAGIPLAGLIISMIGLFMLWPPAVVLAFLGAIAFVGVLIASVNRGGVGRLPAGLRPPQQARPVERTYQHAGQHRRAG